jgi:alkylation response protein AidB-like acyl-CoA dehydrogenase
MYSARRRRGKKYLPRLAAGAISAFALTEVDVGSDPGRLSAMLEDKGDHYLLNGTKLWCTNGTLAEIIVVMARNPSNGEISAVIVEMDSPGVRVEHRCRFMGLRALGNAVLGFRDVTVPKENLIGKEGEGLKIALATLNTGRLALPAGVVGAVKRMLGVCRVWSNERVQWGLPIGRHEAISQKLAHMASMTFSMESVIDLSSRLAARPEYDIRLEAAAAKEFCSEWGWNLVDEAMQIRGGRGYETETSLAARGEKPIGVERVMRDSRINRIFEGSTEIMHLFIAREAVDRHFQVAWAIIDPKVPLGGKIKALPRIAAFYAAWYPSRFVGWGRWPKYREFNELAIQLRYAERTSRRLSRAIFHGMLLYRAKLAKTRRSCDAS